MNRPKDRRCRVCMIPCVGIVCNICYHIKNNKRSGRYLLQQENMMIELDNPTHTEYYN